MADVKHTPGPWMADGHAVWGTRPMRFNLTSGGTPRIALCDAQTDADHPFPAGANALLIAAAPDLLEALQAFVSPWDGDSAQEIEDQTGPATSARIEQARAAIARATGAARATEGSV